MADYTFYIITKLTNFFLNSISVFAILVYRGFKKLEPYLPLKKWMKIAVPAASAIIVISEIYRYIRLFTCEGDFSVIFYFDTVGRIFGYLTLLSSCFLCLVMLAGIYAIGKRYSEYSYKIYGIVLSVLFFVLCGLGYYQFAYPAWSGIVPAIQWVVYVIVLYYHNKTMDEMRGEIEYRLM